jgi:hypothetical protein
VFGATQAIELIRQTLVSCQLCVGSPTLFISTDTGFWGCSQKSILQDHRANKDKAAQDAAIKILRANGAKQVAYADYSDRQSEVKKFQLPNGEYVSGVADMWWSGGFEDGPLINRGREYAHRPF